MLPHDISNIELKNILSKQVLPAIQENSNLISFISKRLEGLEIKVDNHQIILYGSPKDRKDEGIIGVINNIDTFISSIKAWIKPISISIVGAVVLALIKFLVDLYLLVQSHPIAN